MNEEYGHIPKAVYFQCIWLVKDMERLRKLEAMKEYCSDPEVPVFFADDEALARDPRVLDQACRNLECIRKAIKKIPKEYRDETIASMIYGIRPGDMAHENTWKKWRRKFVKELAINLNLI